MEDNKSKRLKYLIDIMRSIAHLLGDATWEGFLLYKIKNVYKAFREGYLYKYPDDKYFLVDDEIMFHFFLLVKKRISQNKATYLINNDKQLNNVEVDKLIIEFFFLPGLILSGVNKRVDVHTKYHSKYLQDMEDELKMNRNEMRVYIEKFKDSKKYKKTKTKIETVKLSIREKVNPKMRAEITRSAEECRFKNGKINYSQLGLKLGVDNKTAKSWCTKYGITHQLPS